MDAEPAPSPTNFRWHRLTVDNVHWLVYQNCLKEITIDGKRLHVYVKCDSSFRTGTARLLVELFLVTQETRDSWIETQNVLLTIVEAEDLDPTLARCWLKHMNSSVRIRVLTRTALQEWKSWLDLAEQRSTNYPRHFPWNIIVKS